MNTQLKNVIADPSTTRKYFMYMFFFFILLNMFSYLFIIYSIDCYQQIQYVLNRAQMELTASEVRVFKWNLQCL